MRTIRSVILSLLACSALHVHGQQPPPKQNDTVLLKIDSLQAAIVTATQRPRMKGDTLEYNTEHIAMPPNALVEELLKRLPGLQIDPDGTITYNGEKIQHLLVDGEDIFGSNPTMVTRNLEAGKIARVEILDRKSENSIFTGIDDGTRTKTLNLVLKQSAKDGYFGRIEAGGNTDGYYNANGSFATLKDKEQFTALGLAANTGVLGLTSSSGNASGSINFIGISDPLQASAGTGIPRYTAAALHYANTWNEQTDHLMANYQYSNYFTRPLTRTESYEAQPGTTYGQIQQNQSTNEQEQHWGYGTYDWVPNSKTALKFTFHGRTEQEQNQFAAAGNSTFNDTLVNSSERTIRDKVSLQNFGGNISWRQQIGKKTGQVLSVSAELKKIKSTTNGFLYSLNKFYRATAGADSADTVDQRKQLIDAPMSITTSIGYLQPLSPHIALALQYERDFTSDQPLQATFDRGDGKYEDRVDSLTSNLATRQTTQRATISLQGTMKRIGFTIGNDWVAYDYRQHDLFTDSLLHINYFNWAPRALISYTPSRTSYINFNYLALNQLPSAAQLQPVRNNTNPLLITMGNPSLRPAFIQDFRLNFRRLKTWILVLALDVMVTRNSISTKTSTDSLGRQISQPVNVNGGRTASLHFTVSRKVLGLDLSWHSGGNFVRTVNYVNADLSRNDAYSGTVGMTLNKFVAGKFSLQLNTDLGYFDQVSSINASAPIRYWTQSHQGSVSLYFIPGFEINTNATYTWQQKTNAFSQNTAVLLWNTYLSRNFMHDNLVLRFQFYNLLNANAGITRTNAANVNTESSTNILGRYWMLSAAWHFDKKFKRK